MLGVCLCYSLVFETWESLVSPAYIGHSIKNVMESCIFLTIVVHLLKVLTRELLRNGFQDLHQANINR